MLSGYTIKLLEKVNSFLAKHEAYIDRVSLYREFNHFFWYLAVYVEEEKMRLFILEQARECGIEAQEHEDSYFHVVIPMSEECIGAAKNMPLSSISSSGVLMRERCQIAEKAGIEIWMGDMEGR